MTPNVEILKTAFREFCVVHLVIRNIHDIFTSAGINQGKSEKNLSGDRRLLVEDYYASLNWENMESIHGSGRMKTASAQSKMTCYCCVLPLGIPNFII